jgi:hypothetical protein
MMLRTILAKYLKCKKLFNEIMLMNKAKICETEIESINKFANEFLAPYLKIMHTQQEWRDSTLWNEQCDSFLKAHLDLL